jgi:hypothetical protein
MPLVSAARLAETPRLVTAGELRDEGSADGGEGPLLTNTVTVAALGAPPLADAGSLVARAADALPAWALALGLGLIVSAAAYLLRGDPRVRRVLRTGS